MKIGVPEDVIAKGSMFVYMVPLLGMITATVIAHSYLLSDGLTATCALFGLLIGAAIVRAVSYLIRFDSRLQPVLIDGHSDVQSEIQSEVQSIKICALE